MEVRTSDHQTLLNWAMRGFIPKRGKKPTCMWTNYFCQHTASFYHRSDVKEDAEKATQIIRKEKDRINAERRKQRAEKRAEHEALLKSYRRNANEWSKFFKTNPLILVFDTETSGLDCDNNDILSISWQLIDASKNFEVVQEKTFYFDWVSDDRVSERAIEVNGLTQERLAELGTSPRAEGMAEFAVAVKQASLLVAHNATFDLGFVREMAHQEDVYLDLKKPVFDTMKEMTVYCDLWRWDSQDHRERRKWPRLSELAECLKIDDSDIDYHTSSADVELTKRCFMEIAKRGLCAPVKE